MNFKTILLGSAAALAVTGAQAADLSIAEPVDYVRVCDAFGAGYWYIPGTDTCIKLSGRARFEVLFSEEAKVGGESYISTIGTYGSVVVSFSEVLTGTGFTTTTIGFTTTAGVDFSYALTTVDTRHSASWQFVSSGVLRTTVKSMTEYGVLTGHAEVKFSSDNDAANTDDVLLDKVYLELGHVLMGRTTSTVSIDGAHTWDGSNRGDYGTDQIRLSWAMHGFGLALALEDPRDEWSTQIGDYGMPAIVGAITAEHGHVSAKLTAGYVDGSAGSAWGVQGVIALAMDSVAAGDELRIGGGWGDTTSTSVSNAFVDATGGGDSYHFFASYQHYWSSVLSSAISYSFNDEGSSADISEFAVNMVWSPVAGFSAGFEALYTETGGSGAWTGKARIQNEW